MAQQFDVTQLIKDAATEPRAAFRGLRDVGLSRPVLWQALVLITVIWVLLFGAFFGWQFQLPGPNPGDDPIPVEITPLVYFIFSISYAVIRVFILHYAGRSLGGTGQFTGAIVVVVLSDLLWVAALGAALVLSFLSLQMAEIVLFLSSLLVMFCTLNYVDELHGFQSLWKALGAILLGMVGAVVGLSILVVLIGAGSA